MDIEALVISVSYIVLTSAFCFYVRKAVESYVTAEPSRFICLEFLATAEMCATGFELLVSKLLVLYTYPL